MKKKENHNNESLENYNNIRERLINEGYKEDIQSISILEANVFAILTSLPLILLFTFSYLSIWNEIYFEIKSLNSAIWITIFFMLSIPVHEFLHGFTWQFFCKERWKSIKFGIAWSKLTPYCHCKEQLNVKKYLTALLMPFLILGVGSGILAIILESPFMLFFSAFNILGAGGDTTIALKILKYRKRDIVILDHPTECGFVGFEK